MNIADALRADITAPIAATAMDAAYIKLIKACARLQREAKDAAYPDMDSTYPESPSYLANQVNDSAHEILDLAHELINTLKNQEGTPLPNTR